MKRSTRVLALSVLGAFAAVPVLLVACSDDTVVDGAGDGDSGAPTATTTSNPLPPVPGDDDDTGSNDGGTDGSVQDDGGEDSGTSIFEAGTVPVTDFVDTFAKEYCGRFQGCCKPDDALKFYDTAACIKNTKLNGLESVGTAPGIFFDDGGLKPTAGNIDVDRLKAIDCVQKLRSFPCITGSAATYRAALDACLSALKGKTANGGVCGTSLECATGYCNAGVCTPTVAPDAGCTTSESCFPRSVSDTCRGPDGDKHCKPPVALNNACTFSVECVPGAVCAGDCSADVNLPVGLNDTESCNGYRKLKDAGAP